MRLRYRTLLLVFATATALFVAVVLLVAWWILIPRSTRHGSDRDRSRDHKVVVRHPAHSPGPSVSAAEPVIPGAEPTDPRVTHLPVGVPLAWPDNTPEPLKPDVFPDQAAAILDDCAPDIVLLSVDCTEPPCLLVTRDERSMWWPMPWILPCSAWNDTYGNDGFEMFSSTVHCGDVDEQMLVFAPSADWAIERGVPKEELARRRDERTTAMRDEWACQENDDP
jgi:hypothetical protein